MEVIKAPTAVICLSPYSGGMEIDSIKMAQKLSPYCETILIAKENNFIANEMVDTTDKITLETIKFSYSLGFSLIFGIRALIKKYKIKNVIFFGASELKSMYFSFLGLDINLIIRHGTTKSRPKKDWFHKLIYSKVAYHISISKHLARNIQYIIPFGKNTKLITISPSVRIQKKTTREPDPSILKIITVGRIAEGKGHKDLINACKILFENNFSFKLTIVGDGEEKFVSYIKEIASSASYSHDITFSGRTDNVASYLDNNDIFLFPSHGEGFSNSFAEALSHGLICIAYNNTAFPEFREMGFHYHLAKDRNLLSLKSILLTISTNIQSEKKLSIANIQTSLKQFNPDKEISSFLKILN